MQYHRLLSLLRHFPRVLQATTAGLTIEEAHRKPSPADWSILEIINHLADEEAEDFRARLQLLLSDPSQDWPPIDPVRWAIERSYNQRELTESLARFSEERGQSIEWLESLQTPDWRLTKTDPRFPAMAAGDLMLSWCCHDQLHLRQLARRRYQLAQSLASDFNSQYAGSW